MPSEKIVAFYRSLRAQPDVWAELNATADADDLIARLGVLAAQNGFDLSREEIGAGLSQMPELVSAAVESDDLTDEELELISAGVLMRATHEHKML